MFTDSNRRDAALAAKGILFIGTGVSGGEEGARNGPSIMPGGNPAGHRPHVNPIFQSIAAKVEDWHSVLRLGGRRRFHYYVEDDPQRH